jgi:hypothetical protein
VVQAPGKPGLLAPAERRGRGVRVLAVIDGELQPTHRAAAYSSSYGGCSHSSATRTVFGRVRALKCSGLQSTSSDVKPGASWLCPTPNHRERFLDMQERLRTARVVTLATLSATAVVVGADGGWPMLVAAVVAVIAVAIGGLRLDRRRRPELWVFVSTILVLQLVLPSALR